MQIYGEPHKVRFWMIEEAVGGSAYIVLAGIYTTEQAAKDAFTPDGDCRAVEYQQGTSNRGPERVTS